MIGLLKDKTLIEHGLLLIGLAGISLSAIFIITALVLPFIDISYLRNGPSFLLFLIGCAGIAMGLILTGLGQALNSLRLLAHNSQPHKEEPL